MREREREIIPKIVFEDSEILVLDKPAGMVVNRAETTKGEETIQDWLERYLKVRRVPQAGDACDTFLARSGIVHRLDKDTSGLLLAAKTPKCFLDLQRQFKERTVGKKYLALVHGKVSGKEGEIKAPVGRLPWQREKFGVFPGGRPAETRYRVKKTYVINGQIYTLLEVSPKTGRTHQIRVHLKYIGHPIVADSHYGGRKTARRDLEIFPRMFLHAFYLSFSHPRTGKRLEFSLPLPEDLKGKLTEG